MFIPLCDAFKTIYIYTQEVGGSDKMQNLDLGLTQKTGGAKHIINDFCFLKFSFWWNFTPPKSEKWFLAHFSIMEITNKA